jgi:hypothetical protein
MVELGDGDGLAQENLPLFALAHARPRVLVEVHGLDRDGAFELWIPPPEHRAHAPGAENVQDEVARQEELADGLPVEGLPPHRLERRLQAIDLVSNRGALLAALRGPPLRARDLVDGLDDRDVSEGGEAGGQQGRHEEGDEPGSPHPRGHPLDRHRGLGRGDEPARGRDGAVSTRDHGLSIVIARGARSGALASGREQGRRESRGLAGHVRGREHAAVHVEQPDDGVAADLLGGEDFGEGRAVDHEPQFALSLVERRRDTDPQNRPVLHDGNRLGGGRGERGIHEIGETRARGPAHLQPFGVHDQRALDRRVGLKESRHHLSHFVPLRREQVGV